jgi:YihY family inner membrane protein
MARASYVGSARAMALGAPPMAWFCTATWPVFAPPLTAALATVLWLVLSVGFSYYVTNFSHYSVTFGALSAGVVLMLWIYYSAFIIALGAAFNSEIERGVQ